MDLLEMPKQFAGIGVDGQRRVTVEVGALSVAAPEVGSRRAGAGKDDPALLIQREAAPGVGATHPLVGVLVLVGLIARLARLGNRVEDPTALAGVDVVGADMARRRERALREPGPDDDHVLINDAGAGHRIVEVVHAFQVEELLPGRSPVQIIVHIDDAVVAE